MNSVTNVTLWWGGLASNSPSLPDLFHFLNVLLHFFNFLFSRTPLRKFYTHIIKIMYAVLHQFTTYVNTIIADIDIAWSGCKSLRLFLDIFAKRTRVSLRYIKYILSGS